MKIIKPSVEILYQGPGLEGLYKHIELCGRVSYKSEDRITEDSAERFVDMLVRSGHTSVLEHGIMYLKYSENDPICALIKNYSFNYATIYPISEMDYLGLINFREVIASGIPIESFEPYMITPKEYSKIARVKGPITAKFICSRAIANEFVRHRKFSFTQESTRYCNYSKGKFGGEVSFIESELVDPSYLEFLKNAEDTYLELLEKGVKPQRARDVLPLCTKTELIMTGSFYWWEHFFNLRCAPDAHPDAQYLAKKLRDMINEA